MIAFFVPGVPAPGGSKDAFPHAATGRMVVRDSCRRNPEWRARVAAFGRTAYRGPLLDGPLKVSMTFFLPRPKGHFGTGRNAGLVRPTAPVYPAIKPDVLKLGRSTEDALTGVLWRDDAATVQLALHKRYADPAAVTGPGVLVEVVPLQQVDV